MNINVHGTKAIELTKIQPVNGQFYRAIWIETAGGQRIEIVLFAPTKQELEIAV